ncbi:MAG TPA: hypothetical protein VMZ92_13950 [Planctomycetota bacterium]|nr:hypothetical protein [Planctomycetota bacterium]
MSAVADRLDLSTADKTELDVVREYLRVQLSSEGTLAESEFVGMGDGLNPIFALDHFPVLAGTLRLLVGGVLQTEGAAANYMIVLATGAVTFNAGSIPAVGAPVTGSYYHGTDPVGPDDTILASLVLAAKQAADAYLNNPFEVNIPQITLAGVTAAEGVTIDGARFIAAAATDVTEREFKVCVSDTLTADELCTCINSPLMAGDGGGYGLSGVTATNSAGVVKLTRRSGRLAPIVAASAYASLLVQYLRTELAIPEPVATWVLQRVGRGYVRRTEGMERESTSGLGSADWGEENFDQLDPYRLSPGL